MVKVKVERETKGAKFKRIASHRTKRMLNDLRLLGNCANRNVYSYSRDDLSKIFNAIETEIKRVKSLFSRPNNKDFVL